MAASCLLIRYSVTKGTGNPTCFFYSHFGVPTARQHGCLQYYIPKGMFHLFSLSISCLTNHENTLIRHFGVPMARQHGCLQYHIPKRDVSPTLPIYFLLHQPEKSADSISSVIKFPPFSPVPRADYTDRTDFFIIL